MALAETTRRVDLHLSERSGHHTLIPSLPGRDHGVVSVEQRSLDEVLAESPGPVDVVKIDVEGAAMRVLRGAKAMLEGNPKVVLLLDVHPQLGVDLNELAQFLRERGFELHEMGGMRKPIGQVHDGLRELTAMRPETAA